MFLQISWVVIVHKAVVITRTVLVPAYQRFRTLEVPEESRPALRGGLMVTEGPRRKRRRNSNQAGRDTAVADLYTAMRRTLVAMGCFSRNNGPGNQDVTEKE